MIKYAASNPSGIQEILFQFVRSQSVLVTVLFGSIVFLQILGRLIRKEEKVLVKILDIVVMYKTISINQLQHSMDMNKPKLERYINKLSNIGRLNINYDGIYVKLELNNQFNNSHGFQRQTNSTDAMPRVSSEQAQQPEFRPAPPAQEPSFDFRQEEESINQATMAANTGNTISSKEDLQNILIKLQGSHQEKQTSGKKFNVVLFIVLFIAFWPFAFIYAASYYMKSQKGSVIENRLKNRLKNM